MKSISVNIDHAIFFAGKERYDATQDPVIQAITTLHEGSGEGSDFLGWLSLPAAVTPEESAAVKESAALLRKECEFVVCIGIGGSYLGAKAVIEALSSNFASIQAPQTGCPKVIFAGQNLSEDYLTDITTLLKGRKFGIIVISKSGTTTEPAVAFRVLRDLLVAQVGKQKASELIVAVTDAEKGALRNMADREGYKTFVIPDNVGGRFSVLTPVGLLPIAVAGFDIDKLLQGAADVQQSSLRPSPTNDAETYARIRTALYQAGKKIEILVNYEPKLHFFAEWWKQLYGESEGKEGKGIFPAAVDFTTDLHSMGQYIQEGERSMFETVLKVEAPQSLLRVPADTLNLDGLNYLAGRRVSEVNDMARIGTRIAHVDGGVPVVEISVPQLSEHTLGQLIFFFEKACGISGYMLGINPFNQPGVEAYKSNMFALLGKPGYEEASAAIRSKI